MKTILILLSASLLTGCITPYQGPSTVGTYQYQPQETVEAREQRIQEYRARLNIINQRLQDNSKNLTAPFQTQQPQRYQVVDQYGRTQTYTIYPQ